MCWSWIYKLYTTILHHTDKMRMFIFVVHTKQEQNRRRKKNKSPTQKRCSSSTCQGTILEGLALTHFSGNSHNKMYAVMFKRPVTFSTTTTKTLLSDNANCYVFKGYFLNCYRSQFAKDNLNS